MSTEQVRELIADYNRYIDGTVEYVNKIQSFNQQISAIDVNSADATVLLKNIKAEKDALQADFVNNYIPILNAANEKFQSIQLSDQDNVAITTIRRDVRAGQSNVFRLGTAFNLQIGSTIQTAEKNLAESRKSSIEDPALVPTEIETQTSPVISQPIPVSREPVVPFFNTPDNPEVRQREISEAERTAFLEANQSPIAPDVDPEAEKVTEYSNSQESIQLDDVELFYQDRALAQTSGVEDSTARGIQAGKTSANQRAIKQDLSNFKQKTDWRVRLSLAPEANYLYKSPNTDDIGILWPLVDTDGIIFPYLPQISVAYAASYDGVDIAHTNYKIFQYRNSSVDNIQVSCDFTAQDTNEAAYLLAVIHFLRSVTKMFYGQDKNPIAGIPPPLCYLHGLGQFQFDNHPLVINSFTYQLPTDVDYIRTDSQKYVKQGLSSTDPRVQIENYMNGFNIETENSRISSSNVPINGENMKINWKRADYNQSPTYVPTKMSISFAAYPVVTRNDISNNFSFKDYGSGRLSQGTRNKRTGIW